MMSESIRLQKKEKLRQKILDVSLDVARQEGWGSVTMRRISAEIKYSLPIIYRHFDNKEAIISQLSITGFERLRLELKDIYENSKDKPASQIICDTLFGFWDFYTQNPETYSVMYGLEGITYTSASAIQSSQELFQQEYQFLTQLNTKFKGKIDNTFEATEIIFSAIHGYIVLSNMQKISESKQRSKKLITEMSRIFSTTWGFE